MSRRCLHSSQWQWMATLTGRVRPQFTAPVPATASQPFADAAMDIDDHDQVPTYNAGVEVDVHQNNNTAAAAALLLLLHLAEGRIDVTDAGRVERNLQLQLGSHFTKRRRHMD